MAIPIVNNTINENRDLVLDGIILHDVEIPGGVIDGIIMENKPVIDKNEELNIGR